MDTGKLVERLRRKRTTGANQRRVEAKVTSFRFCIEKQKSSMIREAGCKSSSVSLSITDDKTSDAHLVYLSTVFQNSSQFGLTSCLFRGEALNLSHVAPCCIMVSETDCNRCAKNEETRPYLTTCFPHIYYLRP